MAILRARQRNLRRLADLGSTVSPAYYDGLAALVAHQILIDADALNDEDEDVRTVLYNS